MLLVNSLCLLFQDDAKTHPSSGHVSVFLGSLLDDQHWHSVLIERFNKQINFTVDRLTKHVRTGGLDDSLEVDYEVRMFLITCIVLLHFCKVCLADPYGKSNFFYPEIQIFVK